MIILSNWAPRAIRSSNLSCSAGAELSAAGDTLAVLYDNSLVLYNQNLEELSRLDNTGYAGQIIAGSDGAALILSASSAWRYLP